MKTITDEQVAEVVDALEDARKLLQQAYDYDSRKYNVVIEIRNCTKAIKIMETL